jgi:hypothetical protein
MMKRAKGATLAEIMEATGWQPHTVRGSSAFWAAKEGRRSSRPRTPRANGRTRSGNNFRQLRPPNAGSATRQGRRSYFQARVSDVTDRSRPKLKPSLCEPGPIRR